MNAYAGYIVETFVTLLAICGLAFAVLIGARKLGIGKARGPIALVGQLPIDARRQIVLVRVGAQILVVGIGEGGFTKLGEIPAADLPTIDDASAGPTLSFSEILARASKGVGRSP